jgi:Tfp pilus assembly protein PilF
MGGAAPARDDAVQRALFALNNGRPQEAERMANELLKADPRHAQALRIYGYALLMQGRAEDAIASLEGAARSRHDPEVDTQLAIAFRQVGRRDEALSRLKRAIKGKPPFAGAFHEMGCLLSSLKRYDEAIEVFSKGLEVAPMMPELSVELGYVFLQRRDCAAAKVSFARALHISPGLHDALLGIAKAHQELGETAAAAEFFRHCLRQKPDDPNLWLNLGHCLLELGQLDAGHDCFRTAARGDDKRYGNALTSLAASGRGRLWLRPSAASQFLRKQKS